MNEREINARTVWSFNIHSEGIDYAVGQTEYDAIFDLARKRRMEACGYSDGIIGGRGGWVLVNQTGHDEWIERGEKLPTTPKN